MTTNAYITDLENRNAELARELEAARSEADDLRTQLDRRNAQLSECRAAGFIDERGEVRKVAGILPVMEDGVMAHYPTGIGAAGTNDRGYAGTKGQRMSKKKVYLRVRLLESWEDGQVKVHVKECDGFSVHLHVKRKDLLIVTPNSNIVPWSPAKAKKKARKQ